MKLYNLYMKWYDLAQLRNNDLGQDLYHRVFEDDRSLHLRSTMVNVSREMGRYSNGN